MNQPIQRETFTPSRLDAAGLEVFLRSEVARLSDNGLQEMYEPAAPEIEPPPLLSDENSALIQSLEEAERQTSAGATAAELRRLWFPLRLLAGGVLYLARSLGNVQRRWNRTIAEVIRSLAASLYRLTGDVEKLRDEFRKLETAWVEQSLLLRKLTERESGRTEGGTERTTSQPALAERHSIPPAPDRSYLDFENYFRGERSLIKERLRVYLPLLRQVSGIGGQDRPILDVGSGRGELLELIREQGWLGWGVDADAALAQECRGRGLTVIDGQALDYLQSLPDASLGAVTAIHVLEHLPFEVLLRFLAQTLRVLKPGGLAIFETPNPENVIVGACTFYLDTTHQRPLHPELLHFLAGQAGFTGLQILRLSEQRGGRDPLPPLPAGHPLTAHLNPLIEAANVRFFGAPDYAIAGRKAA